MLSFIRRAFFPILLAMALLYAPLAHAVVDDRVSTAEEIAIAFFKTGDSTPDFEILAKAGKDYKRMPPVRAGDYLEKEKQRLTTLWRDFNPEEDVIGISGDVHVELKQVVDKKDGKEKYWMYIILPETELTHFGYKYQDYRFAIVPQKIDDLMIQPLQKEQFENMTKEFGMGGPAKLFLTLKPVKAHTDQPYKIDGVERWALICDIATMSVGTKKGMETFWNYGADWYVSPVTEDLQDLYKAPTEGTALPVQTP